MAEQRVPCPACREMIVAGASVCRFCGARFGTKGQFLDPKSNCTSCVTCLLLSVAMLVGLVIIGNTLGPTRRQPRGQAAPVTTRSGG